MKTILQTAVLAALAMGTAVTTVQAEVSGRGFDDGPLLLLAESGSDRLVDFFLRRDTLVTSSSSEDSGERFARMIEDQPTAAGTAREQQEQRVEKSEPGILKNRVLYGPH